MTEEKAPNTPAQQAQHFQEKTGESAGQEGMAARVEAVLERIRPALAMDGGSVELVNVNEKEGIVNVRLVGSCQGCPSSTMTLLFGIENEIRTEVPEITQVVSV